MSNLIIFFLPAFVGFILVLVGIEYRNYALGLLGGLTILSYGVAVLVSPIGTLSSLSNDVLGSALLGTGAYIFITGSVEKVQELYKGGS